MEKIALLTTLMGALVLGGCSKPDPEHKYDNWNCVGFENATRGCAEYDQEEHVSSFIIRGDHGHLIACISRPGHENECNGPGRRNTGIMGDRLQNQIETLISSEKQVMYGVDRAVEEAKKSKKEAE